MPVHVRGGMPSSLAALSLLPLHWAIVACTNCLVASSTVVPIGMETDSPVGESETAVNAPLAMAEKKHSPPYRRPSVPRRVR